MNDSMQDIFSDYNDEKIATIIDSDMNNDLDNNVHISDELKPSVIIEEKNEINEIVKETKTKKKDKVIIVQLILLLIWVILTLLVYFFGYDLFEPFIKID